MTDFPRTYLRPVDEERGRELLAQRRADAEKRRQAAAGRMEDGLNALRRLVEIAKGNTGQCQYVANFLLAWWNAKSCGAFDFTDLWAVDGEIADDMVTVFRLIADRHVYPTDYDLGDDFHEIIVKTRPALLNDD